MMSGLHPFLHAKSNPDTQSMLWWNDKNKKITLKKIKINCSIYSCWCMSLILRHSCVMIACHYVYHAAEPILQSRFNTNTDTDVRSQLRRSFTKGKACLKHLKEIFHSHSLNQCFALLFSFFFFSFLFFFFLMKTFIQLALEIDSVPKLVLSKSLPRHLVYFIPAE